MSFPNFLRCLAALVVLAPAFSHGSAAPAGAQQFQIGWSLITSQGRGGSSSASQVIRATATNPGVQLSNSTATDQPGTYRILDPTQPFVVLDSSETSITTTNNRSTGFSTFTGTGTSVFHTPVGR